MQIMNISSPTSPSSAPGTVGKDATTATGTGAFAALVGGLDKKQKGGGAGAKPSPERVGAKDAREKGKKGERGVVPYYPQPGASFAAVADWRRRAMPALRQVVAAVMLHVFLELRKSALVLRRVAAQLAELPDLLLWDFSPFISLAAGINYYAAQHTDDDGGLCVCLFAWGGRRGEMPPGGEFVMSGLAFPGGFGLACELTEFDVVVFDAHKLHGLARLWGQDPPDAARFSVGLYVPNAVVQNIKRAAVGGCRESGKVRTMRRREARAAAAAERV